MHIYYALRKLLTIQNNQVTQLTRIRVLQRRVVKLLPYHVNPYRENNLLPFGSD